MKNVFVPGLMIPSKFDVKVMLVNPYGGTGMTLFSNVKFIHLGTFSTLSSTTG
ncbi:hypothetical protein [Candidatus Nitrosocosmicus sp. SS]|uniref:hypothetical protein n=1 Tax=Candidatus Nitrosocosmicus agrestis TaxID=2563600 RepID=UPI00133165D7|nr:hypothetical protein [Candidatus Nitrosocosmicus sp. SS]